MEGQERREDRKGGKGREEKEKIEATRGGRIWEERHDERNGEERIEEGMIAEERKR